MTDRITQADLDALHLDENGKPYPGPGRIVHERHWIPVGRKYATGIEQQARFEAVVAGLDWVPVGTGRIPSGAFYGITEAVKQLRLPKVTQVAWNGYYEAPDGDEGDIGYYSVYGIEANYRNGRVRAYLVDAGAHLATVATDFWPNAEAGTFKSAVAT